VGAEAGATGRSLQPQLDQAFAERRRSSETRCQESLGRLDPEEWRSWAELLSMRAARSGSRAWRFQYVALERWHEAYELHRRLCAIAVRRHGTPCALASSASVIRRRTFCREASTLGQGLKEFAGCLGEVHDLDVLWERIRTFGSPTLKPLHIGERESSRTQSPR